ncbi:MAG: type II toxin-antitoxin system VapC family toxin [Defluviitaleaceae bacterium]|nr:type II toxin-antitoxin system VapC family toxin [Defluviitaleaceae bacterium]
MGALGYLLDTHTFLWAVRESHKLSSTAKRAIADTSVKSYVSAVTAYEIMNKYRVGKFNEFEYVVKNYFDILREFDVLELPLNARHAHYAGEFEWEHRDPFDRQLAAQAYIESLTLITGDKAFDTLDWVRTLW